MSPIVISTTMSPSMSQNVFSYRAQPSLYQHCSENLYLQKIRAKNSGSANYYSVFLFFFFKKEKRREKEFFERVRIRVRDEPGLRSFRLKLIQRDELLSPSSWHFTIPLFKIPAIFLAIVSSLEQFIVASGHEFRFFFSLYFGQHPEIHTISNVIPRERHRLKIIEITGSISTDNSAVW